MPPAHGWLLLVPVLTGCLEAQRYEVVRESVSLASAAAPAYVDPDDAPVYRVERSFELRITAPSEAELDARAGMQSPPYARAPWVELSVLELQLDYAVENESEQSLTLELTLDGRNEFHVYTPGPDDLHQWSRRVTLSPREVLTGSISELELDEVAIDLATVVNGAPNSNLVVDPRSQSSRDPRVRAFVPARVPGLVGIHVGLTTMRAADVTLTLSLRVRDQGGRAAHEGEPDWQLPAPVPFAPIVPERD